MRVLSHAQVMTALRSIKSGKLAILWQVPVERVDRWTWIVGNGPETLLLPSIDRIMRAIGYRPVRGIGNVKEPAA